MRALPGDWSRPIVFCAGTAWHGNRGSDQHMAEQLARYAPVLYVDPPSWRAPCRGGARGARLVAVSERLALLTPWGPPGPNRPGMRKTADAAVRWSVRRTLRALGAEPSTVVIACLDDLFGAVPGARRVLYGTDDFVAGAELMGISESRLRRDEGHRLEEADVVVAVSPVLADRWRAPGRDPVLIPNGCDAALFVGADAAPPPADIGLAPPIAGYVGHISRRIDLALLEAVADRGRSLLLVGPAAACDTERFDALRALPNVQWVGPKPFAALPSYLGAVDVGLVPYADTTFNRGSFPLKTLEYLAAGRPVVATALPSIEWLATEHVLVARSPQGYADAVDRALSGDMSSAAVEDRRAFARAHAWEVRARDLAIALGLTDSERLAPCFGSGREAAAASSVRPRTVA